MNLYYLPAQWPSLEQILSNGGDDMTTIHNLGFPRIGAQRELKRAVEAYWAGKQTAEALEETGRELRAKHWKLQAAAGLKFVPVFDYEQVLVVASSHALARVDHVKPRQLGQEVLISYPVPFERLDIYNQFLLPAGITPRRHKTIETTDIMMQMVASGRGVAAMPRWLVEEYAARMDVVPVRLGAKGIPKQIYLGAREADTTIDYLQAFVELARNSTPIASNSLEVGAKALPALRAEADRIPPGTTISIPYLASEDDNARLAAARIVRQLGFEPMPHLSARRIESRAALERFMQRAASEAGVERCLLIAGDLAAPAGPFADSTAIIDTGILEGSGIKVVAIGGHPEGHHVMGSGERWQVLERKCQAIEARRMAPLIITQFAFDADIVLAWLDALRSHGIRVPCFDAGALRHLDRSRAGNGRA
ncbi:hypothetical protein G6F59_013026 [Rhizopus arrhizus]|nr:hypothetical protein G6F59_013026 [Rhizopus arrhizus]